MAPSLSLTAAELGSITAFAGLPTEVLSWLLAQGEICSYADGEIVAEAGDSAEYLIAVLQGGMQFYSVSTGQPEPIFRIGAGQVSGVLPYSRLRTFRAQSVATGATVLYRLHRDQFSPLEKVSPELIQRLVAVMSDRARDEVRGQERDDKLRALGKLSAGLAHEMNNPAAAIARAAQALAAANIAQPQVFCQLLHHCPNPDALALLTELSKPAVGATPTAPRSPLETADQEDTLADWLSTQGVADAYRLAPGLVEAALNETQLLPVAQAFDDTARPLAFAWLEGQLTVGHLTQDIAEASARISKLVGDVKTYSHMDRGTSREPLNVAAGLESTLNMMGFALRQKKIHLTRDYTPDLPLVNGITSSLNQVWTNLIDNAADALPEGGSLTLRTRREGAFVQVLIIDNGPGIPAEVLPHIFEPFYTTKPVGEGSGMGLEIAQRIIQQHDGRLEVQSSAAGTTFCAWLPAMV